MSGIPFFWGAIAVLAFMLLVNSIKVLRETRWRARRGC
jgi:hypothetical protein